MMFEKGRWGSLSVRLLRTISGEYLGDSDVCVRVPFSVYGHEDTSPPSYIVAPGEDPQGGRKSRGRKKKKRRKRTLEERSKGEEKKGDSSFIRPSIGGGGGGDVGVMPQ